MIIELCQIILGHSGIDGPTVLHMHLVVMIEHGIGGYIIVIDTRRLQHAQCRITDEALVLLVEDAFVD